jgi:hypothetical protein
MRSELTYLRIPFAKVLYVARRLLAIDPKVHWRLWLPFQLEHPCLMDKALEKWG